MNVSTNIAAGRVSTPIVSESIDAVLRLGLRLPAELQHDDSWTEIQALDHIRAILKKQLAIPGRPSAGQFVPLGFTEHTPLALHVVTVHNGTTKRANTDVLHVQTSSKTFDKFSILHFLIDRHMLSPRATITLDRLTLKLDAAFLASRDFRVGRNAEFGAGILALGTVPPAAIEAVICADEEAYSRVAAAVIASGLNIAAVVDPTAYFRPKEPRGSEGQIRPRGSKTYPGREHTSPGTPWVMNGPGSESSCRTAISLRPTVGTVPLPAHQPPRSHPPSATGNQNKPNQKSLRACPTPIQIISTSDAIFRIFPYI